MNEVSSRDRRRLAIGLALAAVGTDATKVQEFLDALKAWGYNFHPLRPEKPKKERLNIA